MSSRILWSACGGEEGGEIEADGEGGSLAKALKGDSDSRDELREVGDVGGEEEAEDEEDETRLDSEEDTREEGRVPKAKLWSARAEEAMMSASQKDGGDEGPVRVSISILLLLLSGSGWRVEGIAKGRGETDKPWEGYEGVVEFRGDWEAVAAFHRGSDSFLPSLHNEEGEGKAWGLSNAVVIIKAGWEGNEDDPEKLEE